MQHGCTLIHYKRYTMSLYLPPSFQAAADAGHSLVRDFPFATLITPQTDGTPWITHLPLLPDPQQAGCLLGHLANANPHSSALLQMPSVAIFQGEHGYISPRWYVTAGMVPTWNYRVAHAHGQAEKLSATELQASLQQLAAAFEGDAWTLDEVPPQGLAAMQRSITGFRLRVSHWDIKEKLSQNRRPADISGVIRALQQGSAGDAQLAAIMLARSAGNE